MADGVGPPADLLAEGGIGEHRGDVREGRVVGQDVVETGRHGAILPGVPQPRDTRLMSECGFDAGGQQGRSARQGGGPRGPCEGSRRPSGRCRGGAADGLLPARRAGGRGGPRRGRRVRRARLPAQARADPAAGHRPGPGLHPHRPRARLVRRRPHRGRGGHRRHAVPRRLDDDGADRPRVRARPHRARGHPPPVRGGPRRGRRAAGRPRRRRVAGARRRQREHRRGRRRRARDRPGVLDAHRDRPGDRRGRAGRDRGPAPAGAPRHPRRGRGLAADAGPAPRHRRRDRGAPADAARLRRGGAERGVPALAGRRPLRLPRLPRVHPRGARGRARAECRPGDRAGHPAR